MKKLLIGSTILLAMCSFVISCNNPTSMENEVPQVPTYGPEEIAKPQDYTPNPNARSITSDSSIITVESILSSLKIQSDACYDAAIENAKKVDAAFQQAYEQMEKDKDAFTNNKEVNKEVSYNFDIPSNTYNFESNNGYLKVYINKGNESKNKVFASVDNNPLTKRTVSKASANIKDNYTFELVDNLSPIKSIKQTCILDNELTSELTTGLNSEDCSLNVNMKMANSMSTILYFETINNDITYTGYAQLVSQMGIKGTELFSAIAEKMANDSEFKENFLNYIVGDLSDEDEAKVEEVVEPLLKQYTFKNSVVVFYDKDGKNPYEYKNEKGPIDLLDVVQEIFD